MLGTCAGVEFMDIVVISQYNVSRDLSYCPCSAPSSLSELVLPSRAFEAVTSRICGIVALDEVRELRTTSNRSVI